MANKLIIAGAGSGKTTELIRQALKIKEHEVLISTYTEANAHEIKNKFILEHGHIPLNITIQTWFSLLIQHGLKPYQGAMFDYKIRGMLLVSQKSGFRFKSRNGFPVYWGEDDFFYHYFTSDMRVYSDKLSKLVVKLNSVTEGKTINRLVQIFPSIFIDECQDLAGYDLEVVKLFAEHSNNLILVGDPRQVTYLTHNENKYKKYRNGLIENFLQDECSKLKFEIDLKSLSHSYRCNQFICDYSNKLYPDIISCNSKQVENTEHDGVFLVDKSDALTYLKKFNPVQLRWNIANKDVNPKYLTYNFGQSKGMTFERVLIYPTVDMIEWMKNHNNTLRQEARAKFYVGLTRAKFSVGIICDVSLNYNMNGIRVFE